MKTVQLKKNGNKKWEYLGESFQLKNPLVLVFGNRFALENPNIYQEIRDLFPTGKIVFGSTSGEIVGPKVYTDSIVITAIEFEKSSFIIKRESISKNNLDSKIVGKKLMSQLPTEKLKHVFVISDGSFVNGSELTEGLREANTANVCITGGLCGDGIRFEKTLASYNENPKEGEVIAIGLYGDTLEISSSIKGGWRPFGPEKIITKSKANVLYEVNDVPVLDLYKSYLGNKAGDLPASALRYPLKIKSKTDNRHVVRTILKINEQDKSMTFAGNVPTGARVQLMMTTVDNLASAAETAAFQAMKGRINKPQLALIISCVGRKIVLDKMVEEEIEEVLRIVDDKTVTAGFYSYGEIAPFHGEQNCRLHNQTMTLTLISE